MRYSVLGIVLLAACSSGSGGSDETVDVERAVTANDLKDDLKVIVRAARTDLTTEFPTLPTSGTVDYVGGMIVQWRADPSSSNTAEGIRGLTTLTADFDTGEVTGEVTDILGSEGLEFDSQPFDGSLEISGATLPAENDYVVGTGTFDPLNLQGGVTTGTLTGPDGSELVFNAEFSGDFRGEDAAYFYGVYEGGTVTVDGDAV
jgi:hypothetical protein